MNVDEGTTALGIDVRPDDAVAVAVAGTAVDLRAFLRPSDPLTLAFIDHFAGARQLAEDFDQPDSSTLGPDLTWTQTGTLQTQGGVVRSYAAGLGQARANAPLATANHSIEISVSIPALPPVGATNLFAYATARNSTSADTYFYAVLYTFDAGTSWFLGIGQRTAGTEVAADMDLDVTAFVLNANTLRLEVDGRSPNITARAYLNGVLRKTVTGQTGIDDNQRVGLALLVDAPSAIGVDTLVATDLATLSAAGIAAQLAALESLVATLQDQGVPFLPIASSDEVAVALQDVGTWQIAADNMVIVASDVGAVALSDAALTGPIIRATDATPVALTDVFVSASRLSATDATAVILGSPLPTLRLLGSVDTVRPVLGDSAISSILGPPVIKTAIETLLVRLTDLSGLTIGFEVPGSGEIIDPGEEIDVDEAGIFSNDTFRVFLFQETGLVAIVHQLIEATDEVALTADDANRIRAAFASLDDDAVALVDEALAPLLAQLLAYDDSALAAVEATALVFLEETFFASVVATDALAVDLTETTTEVRVLTTIVATDAAALALDDVATIDTSPPLFSLTSTDDLAVAFGDVAALIRVIATILAADVDAVALSDRAVVFNGLTFLSVLASDVLSPALGELPTAIEIVSLSFASTDDLAVALAETGVTDVLKQLIEGAEAFKVGVTEFTPEGHVAPGYVTALLRAADALAVVLGESAQHVVLTGIVPIRALDNPALGFDDSAINTIIETLLDIRGSDLSLALALDDLGLHTQSAIASGDVVELGTFDLGDAQVILNLLPGHLLIATVTYTSATRTAELAR